MTPYYPLDGATKHIITELIATCTKLNLGNVSFSYFREQVDFYLSENKKGWDLTVSVARSKRDVYSVRRGEIVYLYSEKD